MTTIRSGVALCLLATALVSPVASATGDDAVTACTESTWLGALDPQACGCPLTEEDVVLSTGDCLADLVIDQIRQTELV